MADDATYRAWWDRAALTLEEARLQTYCVLGEEDFASRGLNGDVNTYGARQYAAIADLHRHSRVLEVGCGIARVGRELAPFVGEWHGVDISERMLAFACERTRHLPNVHLHLLEETGLSMFPDSRFDFVYCTTLLMQLDKEDVYGYMREARRVLRSGGLFFCDAWNLMHPDTFRLFRETQAANVGDRKSRGRHQYSTASELGRYLDEAGFAVLRLDEGRLLRALCRRRDRNVHEPDDGLPPFGYVTTPGSEDRVRGPLVLDGWALDVVECVEFVLDGTNGLPAAAVGVARADVAALFPRYADAGRCGFHMEVPDVPLGPHLLGAVAVDRNGLRTDLVGPHLAFLIVP